MIVNPPHRSLSAITLGQHSDEPTSVQFIPPWWWILSAASVGLSAYHGYRRNNSVGWAIVWGLLGGIFPIITPAVAFAQGFGRRSS